MLEYRQFGSAYAILDPHVLYNCFVICSGDWLFFFVTYRKSQDQDLYGAPLDERNHTGAGGDVWKNADGSDLAWNEYIEKFVEIR